MGVFGRRVCVIARSFQINGWEWIMAIQCVLHRVWTRKKIPRREISDDLKCGSFFFPDKHDFSRVFGDCDLAETSAKLCSRTQVRSVATGLCRARCNLRILMYAK